MSARRGGIPGPESRTGLVRPSMSEAEFERRQAIESPDLPPPPATIAISASAPTASLDIESSARGPKPRALRAKTSKPRRVQRMFAIEEEVDKKLWLYAIHMGKDRSEVVNDLLRPLVASMVLYDSRDRRNTAKTAEAEGQGGAVEEG
jgi:hypothetical protein